MSTPRQRTAREILASARRTADSSALDAILGDRTDRVARRIYETRMLLLHERRGLRELPTHWEWVRVAKELPGTFSEVRERTRAIDWLDCILFKMRGFGLVQTSGPHPDDRTPGCSLNLSTVWRLSPLGERWLRANARRCP